jgi:hypothetical protein
MKAPLPILHLFTLFLTITLLLSPGFVSPSSFISTQPINNHTLRFFGTLNCTTGGENECLNTLGFIHVSQTANTIGALIYSSLNITVFDGFKTQTKPYTRYQFNQYTDNASGKEKKSIFAQFPLSLTHNDDESLVGGFFGQLTIHYPKNIDTELPYTLDYDNVPSPVQTPLLNSSRIEVTFGDLAITLEEPYRYLSSHDTLYNPIINKPSHTLNTNFIFNMTIDDSQYQDETHRQVGTPLFSIMFNTPSSPNPSQLFNPSLPDNINPSKVTTSTIDAFYIELTGPIEFFVEQSKSMNTPCSIEVYPQNANSGGIHSNDSNNQSDPNDGQNDPIPIIYNWLGTLQLPRGWPSPDDGNNVKIETDEPLPQSTFFTGLLIKPLPTVTDDLIQIGKNTHEIQINCQSLGSLKVKSMFPYHNPNVKLPNKFIPDIEAIPTYSNVSFNITHIITSDNPQGQQPQHPTPEAPTRVKNMIVVHNTGPLYMLPLDRYFHEEDLDFARNISIICVMIFFSILFSILICTFLRSSYPAFQNVPLPQDCCSKSCCRKEQRLIRYNDHFNTYGIYSNDNEQNNDQNENNKNNDFDRNTSRNTDLNGLLGYNNELSMDGINMISAQSNMELTTADNNKNNMNNSNNNNQNYSNSIHKNKNFSSIQHARNPHLLTTSSNFYDQSVSSGYVMRTSTNYHGGLNKKSAFQ